MNRVDFELVSFVDWARRHNISEKKVVHISERHIRNLFRISEGTFSAIKTSLLEI